MKGVVFQTSMTIIEGSCSAGEVRKGISPSPMPRRQNRVLKNPVRFGCSMKAHICEETAVGMAQGTRMMARIKP